MHVGGFSVETDTDDTVILVLVTACFTSYIILVDFCRGRLSAVKAYKCAWVTSVVAGATDVSLPATCWDVQFWNIEY